MPVRIFEFPIDKEHAKKHNELVGDRRRLQVSSLILTIILGVAAYFAYAKGASVFWVSVLCVLAAVSGVVMVWIPTAIGSIDKTFKKSSLVPAIVADTRENGMTLLALVDLSKKPEESTKWALVARDVHDIPGLRKVIGQKVPCVAVTGSQKLRAGHDYWDLATPMPIAWGTTDRTIIAEARRTIPTTEWDTLSKLRPRLKDVREQRNDVLLLADEDLVV